MSFSKNLPLEHSKNFKYALRALQSAATEDGLLGVIPA